MPQDVPIPSQKDEFTSQRQAMVEGQLRRRGIVSEPVLEAMNHVPRHRFVPPEITHASYNDCPLPLGHGQTISQPYIVALMTELSRPRATDRVLEVGTGCGYQTAVLASLVNEVYSIEIVPALAHEAEHRLSQLGYHNVHIRIGDGHEGWSQFAPFDIILVAAAPPRVPQPLVDQLARGGRMVIPVGRVEQRLLLIERSVDGSLNESYIIPVAFVPMTGQAQV